MLSYGNKGGPTTLSFRQDRSEDLSSIALLLKIPGLEKLSPWLARRRVVSEYDPSQSLSPRETLAHSSCACQFLINRAKPEVLVSLWNLPERASFSKELLEGAELQPREK